MAFRTIFVCWFQLVALVACGSAHDPQVAAEQARVRAGCAPGERLTEPVCRHEGDCVPPPLRLRERPSSGQAASDGSNRQLWCRTCNGTTYTCLGSSDDIDVLRVESVTAEGIDRCVTDDIVSQESSATGQIRRRHEEETARARRLLDEERRQDDAVSRVLKSTR